MLKNIINSKYLRYLSGFILLGLIFCSFYFEELILMFIISVLLIILSINEYRKMFEQKEIYIHKFLPEIVSIFFAFIFCFPVSEYSHNYITPVTVLGIIMTFIVTIAKNKKPYILTSIATIMAFLLVFCGLYVIKITYQFNHNQSVYIVFAYFIAVLMGDFIASIVGPKFIKKLAPEISPNKTIGGAVSSLISACLVCLSLKFFINFPILKCLFFGFVVSVFAQFGDLAISSLKRDLGIKHSGTMFLEYGGILDRMDAFIFSAPIAYYFLILFP